MKANTLINANEDEMVQILDELNTEFDHVDLAKYNGEVTAYNPKSGEHRTFRIKTARKGNLKGARIVSLLNGPCNETDYIGFGFVNENEDGSIAIRVWKKYRGTQFEKLAKFLERADYHAQVNGVEFKFSVCCRKCNRKLTDPESIDLGIGPVCREMM